MAWCSDQTQNCWEQGTGKQNHKWGAVIQVSPDTKTGRREVICPAGVFFKRLNEHYTSHGYTCNKDDLIFRNIGTKNSRAEHHVGQALTLSFLRKLWYELLKDFEIDKGYPLSLNYTIYSARSFFINQRLELGIPPTVVGELVGHTIKTMEKHYKKIAIRKMEPELLMVNRRRLEESEFETWTLISALDQRWDPSVSAWKGCVSWSRWYHQPYQDIVDAIRILLTLCFTYGWQSWRPNIILVSCSGSLNKHAHTNGSPVVVWDCEVLNPGFESLAFIYNLCVLYKIAALWMLLGASAGNHSTQ